MTANVKHKDKLNRLSRIEGQVRGVASMIEDGRYCIDILNQMQAIKAALVRVESQILKDHVSTCVTDAINSDDANDQNKKIDELLDLLEKVKS